MVFRTQQEVIFEIKPCQWVRNTVRIGDLDVRILCKYLPTSPPGSKSNFLESQFFGFLRDFHIVFDLFLMSNSEEAMTSLKYSIVWTANQIASRQGRYQGRIWTAEFRVEAYSPWGRGWVSACYLRFWTFINIYHVSLRYICNWVPQMLKQTPRLLETGV